MSGTRAVFLAVFAALFLSLLGCGPSSKVIMRIPLIREEPLQFSPEEMQQLLQIKTQFPALFDKLQRHNNANAARIRAQNAEALQQREEAWKAAGESGESVKLLRLALEKQFNIRPEKEPDKPERP
jgi:hypothetical protein